MPYRFMFIAFHRRLTRVTLPALAVALAGPARAQVVCYDGFEGYGANAQLESGNTSSDGTGRNGGTGWGGAYDVYNPIKDRVLIENRSSNPVSYTNGGIVLPGGIRALRFYNNADGSYAVRRPLGTVFEAAAGDTLWFSILFRTADGGASPQANQDLFQIGFDDSADPASGNPRVSIGSNTLSTTTFPSACHFFARSTTAPLSSAFQESLPIAAATTYLLVGQVQPNGGVYDTVNLFVNPSNPDDPGPRSATITAPSGLATLSHAFIRTAFLDGGDAYVLDEWRIGRTTTDPWSGRCGMPWQSFPPACPALPRRCAGPPRCPPWCWKVPTPSRRAPGNW